MKPVAWPVSFSRPSNRRGRIFRQFGQVARGAQLADEARRMPGGAGRQLLPLQHHDIGDAILGQVIGNRAADNAAADDDDIGAGGQGLGHGRGLRG